MVVRILMIQSMMNNNILIYFKTRPLMSIAYSHLVHGDICIGEVARQTRADILQISTSEPHRRSQLDRNSSQRLSSFHSFAAQWNQKWVSVQGEIVCFPFR